MIGTDDALPKGCFVELEDEGAVACLKQLLSHADETDVASDVVKADLVRQGCVEQTMVVDALATGHMGRGEKL